ncbi:MAG TPA: tRNA lysidine(34) synthetase TilS [Allosphingosinicella sp.]|nr:tRNA lysidine(34) synthetase TilS [Allosphingosinicella sp.]
MEELAARFRADLEALTGAAPARLGVAVSGGPDSLALLLLAHAAYPGRVHAATVDHGLRAESAAEAAFVAGLCGELGVPHATLAANMTDKVNVQAAARARRYALLGRWAGEVEAGCLLTAHHLDDQAETLVMRLLRGSGLAGLSGVRAVNPPVVRPLLGWRRDELAAIVRAAGVGPVADPSNADERFDRARIRRRLAEAPWLDPVPLARSAAALAAAEVALEWSVERLWHERVDVLTLDPAGLPAELRRRLVLRLLAAIGGPAPRGEEVGRLLATLDGGGTATLAGVKCVGGKRWRFAPAPPRRR